MLVKSIPGQKSKVILASVLLLSLLTSAFRPDKSLNPSDNVHSLQSADYYYYYYGERVPLTPSLEWVSVKLASDNLTSLENSLQVFGALLGPLDERREIPHPKLTLLPLQKGLSLQSIELGINALRKNSSGLLQVNPVFEPSKIEKMVITDAFIAQFSPEKGLEEIARINEAHHVELVEQLSGQDNSFILRVLPEANVDSLSMANWYQESGLAIHAAPDFVHLRDSFPMGDEIKSPAALVTFPNDHYFYDQWALHETDQYGPFMANYDADIDAPEAWSLTNGNPTVIIAILDTGVDLNHEDLKDKLVQGYDATGLLSYGSYTGSTPRNAHGTGVAGLAAAKTNNTHGVAGVCQLCQIMPVRVGYHLPITGDVIQNSWVEKGINWAYQHGASIINLSLGGGSPDQKIADAIMNGMRYGRGGRGTVFVFAAGNNIASNPDFTVDFPASLGVGMSVSALNLCDVIKRRIADDCNKDSSWGSNYGSQVNISAAGLWLDTTDITGPRGFSPGNYYVLFGGTSGAAPIVAGVAGLVLSVNPTLTHSQVRTILENSADDIHTPGRDIFSGYGRVNAYRAVQAAKELDRIFVNSFEDDDCFTTQWSFCVDDGGDLRFDPPTLKPVGSHSMVITIDDNNPVFVALLHPNTERRYRVRFYFDPNSVAMANGNSHFLFQGFRFNFTYSPTLRVEFFRDAGNYKIRTGLITDSLIWSYTPWFTITDAPHYIEFAWRAATAAGANNGVLTLWIDSSRKYDITNVDNDTWRIDMIRLGAAGGIDNGTRGTYYFDEFESRRHLYIGP